MIRAKLQAQLIAQKSQNCSCCLLVIYLSSWTVPLDIEWALVNCWVNWLPCRIEVTHDVLTSDTISHCVLFISCDLQLHTCCALFVLCVLRENTHCVVFISWKPRPQTRFALICHMLAPAQPLVSLHYVCWAVMLWWCFCKFKGLFSTFSSVFSVNTTKFT